MQKRVSWADLTEEEEKESRISPPPLPKWPKSRCLPKQSPNAPFLAARTLYDSVRAGKMEMDQAILRAKHLEDVSPAAAGMLWLWLFGASAP